MLVDSPSAKRALLIVLLAMVATAAGSGQEYDFGPARQSIATLAKVANDTRSWAGVLSAPWPDESQGEDWLLPGGPRALLTGRLGPGVFGVWCGRPGTGNRKRYGYAVPELGGNDLILVIDLLRSAANDTEAFTTPMQHWLKSTVPAISRQFDASTQQMLDIQGEVQRGQGNFAEQRGKAAYQLAQISGSVKNGAVEIEGLMSQLAKYLLAMKGYNQGIREAVARLEKTIPVRLAELREKSLDQTPCPLDEIKNTTRTEQGRSVVYPNGNNGINEIERQINQNLAPIRATPNRIALWTAPADPAGSLLLGTMVNMLNRFHLVSEQLDKAQSASSLNSAIEQLHLRVAARAWKDFAAYAEKQVI